jgi:hypothetical protein
MLGPGQAPDPGAVPPKTTGAQSPPASEGAGDFKPTGDHHLDSERVAVLEEAIREVDRRRADHGKTRRADPAAARLATLSADVVWSVVRQAEDVIVRMYGPAARDLLMTHRDVFRNFITDTAWGLLESIARGMQEHPVLKAALEG